MNALLYAIGDGAKDIMKSFTFTEEADADKNDAVKAKFDNHCEEECNLRER